MAIVTPTDYAPLGQEDFALAAMPGPLNIILKNTNYLYQFHRPPMLSVAYCSQYAIAGRTARFQMPVKPSADGLIYEFTSKVMATSAAAWALTVLVETYDAVNGWQVLTTATTAQIAGTDVVVSDVQTGVLANVVTQIRVSYSDVGATHFTPHHLLAIPTPSAPVTGIKPSGFVPYDDGLLSSTGAITTEHVNRAQQNAMAVLQDRAQCAFAFVQEDDPAQMVIRPGLSPFTLWRHGPAVKVGFFGQQGQVTLNCATLAGVTRGNGLVRIEQVEGQPGSFFQAAADGVLHTGNFNAEVTSAAIDASSKLSMAVKLDDPLAQANLYALIAWWRPTL